MFPSFNCDNSFESFLKNPSDQNPSSTKQDPQPPFLFNFPSPFLDEHESPLSQIFFQTHQMPEDLSPPDQTNNNPIQNDAAERRIGKSKLFERVADMEIPSPIAAPFKRRNLGVVPRRRTGKKDRHSKICTAQGVRDRRMRLSLQVARKFFDLQDMLGYDKASKTIEWLFTKSKKAIKELINDHHPANYNISISDAKSESFLSECEVVSGLNQDLKEYVVPPAKTQKITSKSDARESRERARAWARSRTQEKKMAKGLEYSGGWCEPNPNGNGDVQKLGFSEGVDQESKSKNQERVSPFEASCNSLEYSLADVSTIKKFLGNSSSSSSSSSWGKTMLPVSALVGCASSGNYPAAVAEPDCSFMGFFGNWNMLNNDITSSIYAVANQVSLAGNPNSVYSATEEFP